MAHGMGYQYIDTCALLNDNAIQAIYSTVAIYNFTQMLYKLSITCQAHRIFKTDPTRTIINFLIIWLAICGIMTVCGALFYCSPVAKCWDESIPGHCGNRSAMVYSWAGFNLLNDIIILGEQTKSVVLSDGSELEEESKAGFGSMAGFVGPGKLLLTEVFFFFSFFLGQFCQFRIS